tara:strand:- start:245 stop:496 length:252 start_codon:yes stop_codon:yes gene_type:complete
MTQYTDRVEKQRTKQAAEKWGKRVKYIHANNGVIETAFNNGDIKYETRQKTGKYKTHWHRENKESLIRRWQVALVDMISGVKE